MPLGCFHPIDDATKCAAFDLFDAGFGSAFQGAIFDKTFVHFIPSPSSSRILRFDAREPPAVPPAYNGSWL